MCLFCKSNYILLSTKNICHKLPTCFSYFKIYHFAYIEYDPWWNDNNSIKIIQPILNFI